jgi:hypothetical protein
MSTEHDYHGQEYVAGQAARDVPAKPGGNDGDSGMLRDPGPGNDIQVYSRVEIQGNYGAFCAQHQTTHLHDVTLEQARKVKWDYYGVCSSQMTCYDQSGKPVHQE